MSSGNLPDWFVAGCICATVFAWIGFSLFGGRDQ